MIPHHYIHFLQVDKLLTDVDDRVSKRSAVQRVDNLLRHSQHLGSPFKAHCYSVIRSTIVASKKMKRQSRRSPLEDLMVMHNLDNPKRKPALPFSIRFGFDHTQNVFRDIEIHISSYPPYIVPIRRVLSLELLNVEDEDPKLIDAPTDSTDILQIILDSVDGFESLRALKMWELYELANVKPTFINTRFKTKNNNYNV